MEEGLQGAPRGERDIGGFLLRSCQNPETTNCMFSLNQICFIRRAFIWRAFNRTSLEQVLTCLVADFNSETLSVYLANL